jgi:hypothetical protein
MWGRGIVALGLAASLALVAVTASCGGDDDDSAKSAPVGASDSAEEKAFYDAVFASDPFSTLSGGGTIDTSSISDERLLAGGRDFCDAFREIKTGNTDANLERPNSEDFDPVAQRVSSSRLGAAKKSDGTTGNAPVLFAYAVGIAAVNNLCPEYRAALG